MARTAENGQPTRRLDPSPQRTFGIEGEFNLARAQNLRTFNGHGQRCTEGWQTLIAQNFVREQHIIRGDRRAI